MTDALNTVFVDKTEIKFDTQPVKYLNSNQ